MTQSKPRLIYVGDPMCSWCYGITPELTKVLSLYGDNLNVELVMGGLRPYNPETMSDLKSFLTHHWQDVHAASGQKFNYEILNDSNITYDTEPPIRAVVIIREMAPTKEMKFFKAIQTLFYLENKNMHLAESYKELIVSYDLDYQKFKELFESSTFKERVKQDFARANELGANSFPTLLLEHNGEIYVVNRGYAKADQIIEKIDRIRSSE